MRPPTATLSFSIWQKIRIQYKPGKDIFFEAHQIVQLEYEKKRSLTKLVIGVLLRTGSSILKVPSTAEEAQLFFPKLNPLVRQVEQTCDVAHDKEVGRS